MPALYPAYREASRISAAESLAQEAAMAAKRAGLIEAPQGGVIQAPNLGNDTSPLVAKAYDDLARAADNIGRALQPAVDNATEERAIKKVGEGDFARTGGITRQDDIYNKVIDAGFMAEAANSVDGFITKLETDNLTTLDGEMFATQNDAARTEYLKGIDSRYAVPLGQLWDKQASAAAQRINGLATQRAATRAVESLKARQQLLLDRVSGASNPDDPQIAEALGELDSVLNARAANPLDNFTDDDALQIRENALSRMSANRVADEAMSLFEGGGRTDDAYTAAAKLLDDAISSPDLALSRTERATYLGAARSGLNAARSEARREERELAAQLREAEARAAAAFSVEYSDATLRAGEGYAPDAAEIADLRRLALASGNPRNVARVARIETTANIQSEMRGYSVPEQESFVASLEALAAGGNADAAMQLDPARKVAAATRSAASNDPATYAAVREGREPPRVDWTKPESTVETLTGRFNEAEVAAKGLGVPAKYFSPADRAQLKAIAETGTTEVKLATASLIVESARNAGVDPLLPLSEIAGTSGPLMSTAGALIAQGAPTSNAMLILNGPEAMKADIVKNAMPSQSTQARVQRDVLGDRMGRLPSAELDALTRAADAHYAANILQGGEKGSKGYENSMRAVTGEWKDDSGAAWGGPVDLGAGRRTRAPSWIRQKSFGAIVSSLNMDEITLALDGNDGLIRRPDGLLTYPLLSDYRSAAWIEVGPGQYYVAPNPAKPNAVLKNENGEPSLFDLNRARDALKLRQPDAVM
jgi:hypothetical protein